MLLPAHERSTPSGEISQQQLRSCTSSAVMYTLALFILHFQLSLHLKVRLSLLLDALLFHISDYAGVHCLEATDGQISMGYQYISRQESAVRQRQLDQRDVQLARQFEPSERKLQCRL